MQRHHQSLTDFQRTVTEKKRKSPSYDSHRKEDYPDNETQGRGSVNLSQAILSVFPPSKKQYIPPSSRTSHQRVEQGGGKVNDTSGANMERPMAIGVAIQPPHQLLPPPPTHPTIPTQISLNQAKHNVVKGKTSYASTSKYCSSCSKDLRRSDYSNTQWSKKDEIRRCKDCIVVGTILPTITISYASSNKEKQSTESAGPIELPETLECNIPTTVRPETLTVRKIVQNLCQLYKFRGLSPFLIQKFNLNFTEWIRDGDKRAIHTCIFTCPISGEHFQCGRLRIKKDEFKCIEEEGVTLYGYKKSAIQAAAARALDCFLFREHREYDNSARYRCLDVPYMQNSGPPLPHLPERIAEKLGKKRSLLMNEFLKEQQGFRGREMDDQSRWPKYATPEASSSKQQTVETVEDPMKRPIQTDLGTWERGEEGKPQTETNSLGETAGTNADKKPQAAPESKIGESEKKHCSCCDKDLPEKGYSYSQWSKDRAKCRDCTLAIRDMEDSFAKDSFAMAIGKAMMIEQRIEDFNKLSYVVLKKRYILQGVLGRIHLTHWNLYFTSWTSKSIRNQKEQPILFTCIFTCPVSGEHFPCGRLKETIDGVIAWEGAYWYNNIKDAMMAAAARALDCFSHRESQSNCTANPYMCRDAPYMQNSGPPLLMPQNKAVLPNIIVSSDEMKHNTESIKHLEPPKQIKVRRIFMHEMVGVQMLKNLLELYDIRGCNQTESVLLNYTTWSNGDIAGSCQKPLYTCIFTCPISGEHFPCGRLGNEKEQKEGFIWYSNVNSAKKAAAARTLDCFSLREYHDSIVVPYRCSDAPYMQNSGPPLPNIPQPVLDKLEWARINSREKVNIGAQSSQNQIVQEDDEIDREQLNGKVCKMHAENMPNPMKECKAGDLSEQHAKKPKPDTVHDNNVVEQRYGAKAPDAKQRLEAIPANRLIRITVEAVEILSTPFLQEYALGTLVKSGRQTFQSTHPELKDRCKSLTNAMKRVSTEQQKCTPQDFESRTNTATKNMSLINGIIENAKSVTQEAKKDEFKPPESHVPMAKLHSSQAVQHKKNDVDTDLGDAPTNQTRITFDVKAPDKKEKPPGLSEDEIVKFRKMLVIFFSLAKGEHVQGELALKDVCITAESESSGSCSFLLQKFFDDLYGLETKKSTDMTRCRRVLFGHMNDRHKNNVTKGVLSNWRVSYKKQESYGFSSKKKAKEQESLDTAIDQGGPLRQFKTDIWRQMNTLSIPVWRKPAKKERQRVMIKIFEDTSNSEGSCVVPITDAVLESRIKNVATDDAGEIQDAIQRAKDYTRAIGRIMLHSFVNGHTVSSTVMAPFFINVILRGCFPGDKGYGQDDVLRHIDGILVMNPAQNLISFLLGGGECDDEGKPWTDETIFSKFIPNEFIYSRSILLGAFTDGLTLGGKLNASNELKEGSGLSGVLGTIPLEALQKILFSRPLITLDDLISILSPLFCEGETDWDGNEEEMILLRDKQEEFFENEFKRYLREGASQLYFLAKFVESCTGSNYLPFMSPDGTPFNIVVEFNLIAPEPGCHPCFQTCSNTIRLPGMGLYFGDYDLFRQKMNEAIESSFNQFNTQ